MCRQLANHDQIRFGHVVIVIKFAREVDSHEQCLDCNCRPIVAFMKDLENKFILRANEGSLCRVRFVEPESELWNISGVRFPTSNWNCRLALIKPALPLKQVHFMKRCSFPKKAEIATTRRGEFSDETHFYRGHNAQLDVGRDRWQSSCLCLHCHLQDRPSFRGTNSGSVWLSIFWFNNKSKERRTAIVRAIRFLLFTLLF
jgi:hypothetical protein